MMEPDFDPLALDKNMPQSAQEAILLLMRTWPLYEIALAYALSFCSDAD
jgi:hypothetical protein